MGFFRKNRSKFGIAGNVCYTVIFLFTLVVAINALVGVLTYYQPAVFGYSVSKIMSASMKADGFEVDDYVITKKVRNREELKVRDDSINQRGSIIAFYVDGSKKPLREGDDRKDHRIMFHEIVAINENGEYITKGSSNPSNDIHPVPFESISGEYIETGAIMDFVIKIILAENRFLYWIVGVLALIAIKQFFSFGTAVKDYKLQRDVISGKRRLLSKSCFEKNVFADFSDKEKKRLIDGAPYGMALLYEYLLYGRVSDRSDATLAKELANKRCGISDALYLTYALEKDSDLDTVQYCRDLPERKKKFDKYRNIRELKKEHNVDRNTALSLFIGCFVFFIIHFSISLFLNYFFIAPWYEIAMVVLLPIITALYLFMVLWENNNTLKKLESYLAISSGLPERYQFMVHPEDYTEEEIDKSVDEIRIRLLEGICESAIEESGVVEFEGQAQQKIPQQIIYVTQNFYGNKQDRDETVVEALEAIPRELESYEEVLAEEVNDASQIAQYGSDELDDVASSDGVAMSDSSNDKSVVNRLVRSSSPRLDDSGDGEIDLNADITMDFGQLLGYEMDDSGRLSVVKDEAEIVRSVFEQFLLGKTYQDIAKWLDENNVPTTGRSSNWRKPQVKAMLQNERYIGAVVIKSKIKEAHGWNTRQNIIHNNHEPIISREIFDATSDEIRRRSDIWSSSEAGKRLQKGKYAFGGAIECGICGEPLRRLNYKMNGRVEKVWACISSSSSRSACTQAPLKETHLQRQFMLVINSLISDKSKMYEVLKDKDADGKIAKSLSHKMEVLDQRISKAQAKLVELDSKRYSQASQQSSDYDEQISTLSLELAKMFEERRLLEKEIDFNHVSKTIFEQMSEILSGNNQLTEFDEDIFTMLVSNIKVTNKSDITFVLRNGVQLKCIIQ